jgi:hypothetical protein
MEEAKNNQLEIADLKEIKMLPNVFSADQFEHAQRVAKALSSSDLVPKEYKNNIANTLIALDISYRIGASPLMVMQHLNIIRGKPSWSSTFLIAAINTCGRFSSLKFKIEGEGDQKGCIAYTTDLKTGEILESPKITMEMAKQEGWISKEGSKWKTMPDLMMRYRSAAFFSRLYAPEITMGMQTVEEIQDAEIILEPKDKATDIVNRIKESNSGQSPLITNETEIKPNESF